MLTDNEKRFKTEEILGIGALILQLGELDELLATFNAIDKPGAKKYAELAKTIKTAQAKIKAIAPQFAPKTLDPQKLYQPQL